MKIDLDRLCRRLNYQFKKPAYLKQALTHCSVGSDNYERFEFLGDSILSFVIANELFNRFPLQSEGHLSRLRSFLVKGEMLAEIAREIELGDFLILGQGELRSGGFRRASILADALEAIFAAIFFDGGIAVAQKVKKQLDDANFIVPLHIDPLLSYDNVNIELNRIKKISDRYIGKRKAHIYCVRTRRPEQNYKMV